MATVDELLNRAQQLLERLDKLQITGPGWSGNTRRGFSFKPTSTGGDVGEIVGFSGPPNIFPPPVLIFGACCDNGDCTGVTTEDGCDTDWQGADTSCSPNVCPPAPGGTGACCVAGACLSSVSAAACAGFGGVYLGNDSICGTSCALCFNAFSGDFCGACVTHCGPFPLIPANILCFDASTKYQCCLAGGGCMPGSVSCLHCSACIGPGGGCFQLFDKWCYCNAGIIVGGTCLHTGQCP